MTKPELTTEQKQSLTIVMLDVEVTQLRLDIAQREVEKHREKANAQLRAYYVPGYRIDLQTMEYVPVPEAPKLVDPPAPVDGPTEPPSN